MNGIFSFKPGRFLGANGFAEARDDDGFVLMHGEEQRAPLQRGEEDEERRSAS